MLYNVFEGRQVYCSAVHLLHHILRSTPASSCCCDYAQEASVIRNYVHGTPAIQHVLHLVGILKYCVGLSVIICIVSLRRCNSPPRN